MECCTAKVPRSSETVLMNPAKHNPSWNVLKGRLEQAYGELTGNHSVFEQGNEDQLVGWLQMKLGKPEDEVRTSWPRPTYATPGQVYEVRHRFERKA